MYKNYFSSRRTFCTFEFSRSFCIFFRRRSKSVQRFGPETSQLCTFFWPSLKKCTKSLLGYILHCIPTEASERVAIRSMHGASAGSVRLTDEGLAGVAILPTDVPSVGVARLTDGALVGDAIQPTDMASAGGAICGSVPSLATWPRRINYLKYKFIKI